MYGKDIQTSINAVVKRRIPSPLCPALNRVLREKARMRGYKISLSPLFHPLSPTLSRRERELTERQWPVVHIQIFRVFPAGF
jgi:hypothetical protein